MKKRRFNDSLPSDLLSEELQPLCKSNYKSDSSRCVGRTSRNRLKLRKMSEQTFPRGLAASPGWNAPDWGCETNQQPSAAVASPSCVSRLCLYIIDSQRRLLPTNRLPRQFFVKGGSRWSDEIRVTFGWPLLDKDSLHQLSPVILRCFYVMGAFVGFSAEQHTFRLTLKQIYCQIWVLKTLHKLSLRRTTARLLTYTSARI